MLEIILVGKLMTVLATAVAAGTAVVILACIFWDDIVNWFRQFTAQVESDPNLTAVTIAESMQAGNYKIVQGIYNKKTETVVGARQINSKDIDEQLKQIHKDSKVAVYS